MPITPFHFGPGAALHVLAPRSVSLIAFCAANVLIDIEPVYYIITRQYPLHRFFHTYVGATIIAVVTVLVLGGMQMLSARWRIRDLSGLRSVGVRALAIGASAGTWSHIVLDSVMHADIMPFAPWSASNGLYQMLSLPALHWWCAGAGLFALLIHGVRVMRQKNRPD